MDRIPDDSHFATIRRSAYTLYNQYMAAPDRAGMSVPVLLALAAPGLMLNRLKVNSVQTHIEAADAGARIASRVLREPVRSPFQTDPTPLTDVGVLHPGDSLPTDDERKACPGIVFQTAVLSPTSEAVDQMAEIFKVNQLQREFLHGQ